MRDPDASLHMDELTVVRELREPLPDVHFLRSDLARQWTRSDMLVEFELRDALSVVAPRLPFVSQPSEWCDAQLHAAAELTLRLQKEAVAAGYDLKDAPASNVIFAGTCPVFCDLMSFVPLREKKWWAAGQFARHFVLPLALARLRGLHAHHLLQTWRDGVPPDVASRLLGPGRFMTRFWPLVAGGGAGSGNTSKRYESGKEGESGEAIARFRAALHSSLAWMLAGARPKPSPKAEPGADWQGYAEHRPHYDTHSLTLKRRQVGEWLNRLKPGWVADFGCNTGEFSRMALEAGANVVALDADHDSVQRLFSAGLASKRLHPVVATLDDLRGGRGWAGTEFPGLAQRLEHRFDLVMMLALVHHLAVAAAVPLDEVARFAAKCTRRWLVVEWIDQADPQLQLLCARRQRNVSDFSADRQRAAFQRAGFQIETELGLGATVRTLALLQKSR